MHRKALDIYEEYPEVYEKKYIKKKIEGQYRDVMFYTMKKKYQYAVPTIKYFNVIKGFIFGIVVSNCY